MPIARWKPNAPAQRDFLADRTHRFPCLVSGFRGGKTWAGARGHVVRRILNRCPGLIVAETYKQAAQVMIPEVMAAAKEAGLRPKWRSADQVIVYRKLKDQRDLMYGGHVVSYVRSADKAERIAGFEVGDAWADEIGRWPRHDEEPMRDPWTQTIARVSDRRAQLPQILVTGTHEGKGTKLYEDWVEVPKDGHQLYQGSTRDNAANLEDGYIPSLESSYDAELLEQYLDGHAVDLASPYAYHAYGEHNHGVTAYNPDTPLYLWWDFNVSPMCLGWGQVQGEPPEAPMHILGETEIRGRANSGDAAREWAGNFQSHRSLVYVFGDATGKRGDTRSKIDDWVAVFSELTAVFGDRMVPRVPRSNPAVRERVNRVNALLRDGTGRVRLMLDPMECPVHVRDLRRVKWRISAAAAGTVELDKREPMLTHMTDALGYMAHVCYPPAPIRQPDASGVRGERQRPKPAGPNPWDTGKSPDPMAGKTGGVSPWK